MKLNLGCGTRFLATWVNLDFRGQPGVRAHDLRTPLPFSDGTFDVLYHSHVLEHFERGDAQRLLGECHRVLRPGGILRVVVPDLEQKARLYLEKLERALIDRNPRTLADHEWMVIETLDQLVRLRSGGEMIEHLRAASEGSFAAERIGDEFHKARMNPAPEHTAPARPGLRGRLVRFARRVAGISETEWRWIQFRRSGESHLWMYDRLSLSSALSRVGFSESEVATARQSRIPDWENDGMWLDMEGGSVRKPDSLYMEAIKGPGPRDRSPAASSV